ncbi:metal-dependent hydrolase [Caminibacter sp.]
MANFATHLNVSAFVSGIGAVSISYAFNDTKSAVFYFFAGIVGGVLPDIDHDKSTPLRILQFFFSNLISFLVSFKFIGKIPIGNVLLIWFSSYLFISFLFFLLKKITKHRGMIHSIPSGFIFWFLTSLSAYKFFDFSIQKSYLLGFFLFLGYITHLILDEIYSVDITGRKIKRSFGSAFKVCSKDKALNLLIYTTLILIFLFLPEKNILLHIIKGLGNV